MNEDRKPVQFHLDPSLHDALKRMAKEENRTMTNWIKNMIARAWDKFCEEKMKGGD